MKILALGASNSKNSINKALAMYASSLIGEAKVDVLDLNDFELPMYSEDREKEIGQPKLAQNFIAKMNSADAIIVSFAEHNGTYTVAFKNILDWASRVSRDVYQNKPVIFLATSPGPGGASNVLNTALQSAQFFGANVKGSLSVPSFYENFDSSTLQLSNPQLRSELEIIVKSLTNEVGEKHA
ncbi:NADPH-dependent FMN reductase [Pseudoalteromonas luteoviolacea]|uniref:NADPH-dependent FMN reductase n=1 Tax=Pseudoalteromonas luteoviolacea TaxID=43657 RepID=A0A1C0TWH7_9GAMM|nr:NAD(P)H-dependent oxidoreductase [Pseudoalteromonas luteoviolacea]MBQ4810195.1 NAD(P)H-dependent oxidoreductase [Pseudoalteromonas luteoviolacea]OCQ23670.1 NADPH-dependent FMN reductase [Pseudoalteromonas luteoviolacea]